MRAREQRPLSPPPPLPPMSAIDKAAAAVAYLRDKCGLLPTWLFALCAIALVLQLSRLSAEGSLSKLKSHRDELHFSAYTVMLLTFGPVAATLHPDGSWVVIALVVSWLGWCMSLAAYYTCRVMTPASVRKADDAADAAAHRAVYLHGVFSMALVLGVFLVKGLLD